MTRLWQPRETRLLSEWVSQTFTEDTVMYRVRLGGPPAWAQASIENGAPAGIYTVYQRWADAIIIRKTDLIIIEAKIRLEPGVISQIKLYERLLPKTAAFYKFRELPIRLIILAAMRDPEVEAMAASEGIEVVVFSPDWVVDYLKEIKRYRER